MKQTPNWDDIRYFLAIIQTGSLSGAARLLKVEHTTVSRRLDSLEANLGIRLFDRLPRAWHMTAEAENLLPLAQKIEEEMLSFLRTVDSSISLSGTVRISAPTVLASHLLIPHLGELHTNLPKIELEIICDAKEANLTRREADIALRNTHNPNLMGMAKWQLASISYGLYGATDYVSQRNPSEFEFMGYEESLRHTPQQQWLETITNSQTYVLRSNDLGAIFQATIAGLGVAVLPHFLGRQALNLVCIDPPTCDVRRTLWLIMHDDMRRSPRVSAVANEIMRIFNSSTIQRLI